jgi:hypothetical protein
MKSIAYHLLDIVQNSLRAGATLVEITLNEDAGKDLLSLQVSDNGKGMDPRALSRATDPYYTSRKSRKVGLGLPLLKQNAEQTGGHFDLASTPGSGTTLCARFVRGHLDLPARGDIPGTIHQLMVANPGKDFVYRHTFNGLNFVLDSREIKEALEDWHLDHPAISGLVREYIDSCFSQIRPDRDDSVVEHT